MEIGFIGLGKMGMNMVTRLQRDRHRVVVYDRSADLITQAESVGCIGASSLADLVGQLKSPQAHALRIGGHQRQQRVKASFHKTCESKIHPYSNPALSAWRVRLTILSTEMSGFSVIPNCMAVPLIHDARRRI